MLLFTSEWFIHIIRVTKAVEPFWEDPEFESKVKEGVISEKKIQS